VGKVTGLVSLRSYVAPGACGGPVVDDVMGVRGFIVAGATDPDEPYSLAYPSSQWARVVNAGRARPLKPRPGRAF
jgi:hypothetical protein